ncbi:MAG: outer membrane homotrimeric porin [Thermodesulfobacteriota bacterium]
MKKLLILTLVAVFALGAGAANAATKLSTKGEMAFGYQWLDNPDFFEMNDDNNSEDDFQAYQRLRVFFDWSASETLRGVLGIEAGVSNWGVSGGGADLDADDVAIEVKHAYLDFTWPNTALSFRMGVQPIALPGAVAGSPILDGDAAGILASYPVNDMISGAFGWFRVQDASAGTERAGARNDGVADEIDVLALLLPIKGDGFTFTPWAAYAIVGQNATLNANGGVGLAYNGLIGNNTGALSDNLDAWWIGGAFTLDMFAPFSIKGDLIYGFTDGANGSDKGGVGEREGWFFDLAVDYKMDMVTPGLFFMYSTGEDDDRAGSERIPTLYGCYYPTSLATAGAASVLDGIADGVLTNDGTMGLWMLGGQLANFSFVDKLSHTLRVAYGQGTTDQDFVKKGYATQNAGYNNYNSMAYLTEKDSFWEVNFDSSYAIYENLTGYVELGYLNVDLDDVWKSHSHALGVQDVSKAQDVWKLAIALKYAF